MIKIPFGWLPAHWGLAGKTKERARAEYELSGLDLDLRLLEIDKDSYSERKYESARLGILFKHQSINESDYLRSMAELIEDETQRELSLLELDYKEGKIGEVQYMKRTATLKGEPWVTVLNMSFNRKNSLEGSFELDWNQHFVDHLRKEGYQGISDENVVNQWFMELCKNIALEEFGGVGNFEADSQANLEAFNRWNTGQVENMKDGRKGYK